MKGTGIVSGLLTVLLVLFCSTTVSAQSVEATGVGVDRDHALNNALQLAVESAIGVLVDSGTLVENFTVVKDEIVTHSVGYVESYKILTEKPEPDGGHSVTISALVNSGRISDDMTSLDVLMKMAGHPRILVLGTDTELTSIPTGTQVFQTLVEDVKRVFREKFRFEVIDWDTVRQAHKNLPGKLTKERALKHNDVIRADNLITFSLEYASAQANPAPVDMTMSAIRISDDFMIKSVTQRIGSVSSGGLTAPEKDRRAIALAGEHIFSLAVQTARAVVEDLQGEVERGKGFRYLITFYDFPDAKALEDQLTVLSGFVRYSVEKSTPTTLELSYWSNLRESALLERVQKLIEERGHKYKFKQEGRALRFKWEHPEGF
ncbi:MAG: hypothetical protein EOM25_01585 [Deltaproteobacteria bacterium]|nr:hypothetical protein [Deltaproteobacteria bacterium]